MGGRREDDWTCSSCGNVNMRNCTQSRPSDHSSGPRPVFFPEDKPQKASGGTRDNDWACPKCLNVNFSFRTVCNMRRCNTPKPVSLGGKPGKNADMPLPEGSWKCEKCDNINYPFRTKCNRQTCGADKPSKIKIPLLDVSYQEPRPGFFPEDKPQKASGGTRYNDWACPKCGNVNFSSRKVCNMRKCNTPKPVSLGSKAGKNANTPLPEGSWKCDNINYPFRTKCNRHTCSADKPSENVIPLLDVSDQGFLLFR